MGTERKKLVAGNWKMYKTPGEAVSLVTQILAAPPPRSDREVVVCPPFVALSRVAHLLKGSPVKLGAQNVYWEKEGAFTGEVSASMLREVGCEYVIVGHSERRQYFADDNPAVARKLRAVVEEGMSPILCIGEKLEEREAGRTQDVIRSHIEGALGEFDARYLRGLVVAYEPVWAIGTGKTATPEMAVEAHRFARKLLGEMFGVAFGVETRILYGGSVKPENAAELLKEPEIDGALVGGASLKVDSFLRIAAA
ncbi:MAG: triose-phosphate isomerase [Candidatus Eiseniibacteriota bacterium]|nr:MAG: triose-phosphate isomerase [Candidatus Eisenbacteria bacterium]